jgi:hypothetical protein
MLKKTNEQPLSLVEIDSKFAAVLSQYQQYALKSQKEFPKLVHQLLTERNYDDLLATILAMSDEDSDFNRFTYLPLIGICQFMLFNIPAAISW